jgi:hypothetical protein
MVSLVPQKVPQKVPQGLSVRGCLLVFSHVKKPGFSRILDSHEHTRTPYLYLGVKGSQVQILSARLKCEKAVHRTAFSHFPVLFEVAPASRWAHGARRDPTHAISARACNANASVRRARGSCRSTAIRSLMRAMRCFIVL